MHNFFHPQQTLVQALDNIPHPILVARLQLAGPIFDVEKKWEKQGGKTFKRMLRSLVGGRFSIAYLLPIEPSSIHHSSKTIAGLL